MSKYRTPALPKQHYSECQIQDMQKKKENCSQIINMVTNTEIIKEERMQNGILYNIKTKKITVRSEKCYME